MATLPGMIDFLYKTGEYLLHNLLRATSVTWHQSSTRPIDAMLEGD